MKLNVKTTTTTIIIIILITTFDTDKGLHLHSKKAAVDSDNRVRAFLKHAGHQDMFFLNKTDWFHGHA